LREKINGGKMASRRKRDRKHDRENTNKSPQELIEMVRRCEGDGESARPARRALKKRGVFLS
jgi:hypothetical protein